jgi:hypothetical protein
MPAEIVSLRDRILDVNDAKFHKPFVPVLLLFAFALSTRLKMPSRLLE